MSPPLAGWKTWWVQVRSLCAAAGARAQPFERLLLEALRDHVFWRRNFHPEDGFLIQESERRAPGYEASVSALSEALLSLCLPPGRAGGGPTSLRTLEETNAFIARLHGGAR